MFLMHKQPNLKEFNRKIKKRKKRKKRRKRKKGKKRSRQAQADTSSQTASDSFNTSPTSIIGLVVPGAVGNSYGFDVGAGLLIGESKVEVKIGEETLKPEPQENTRVYGTSQVKLGKNIRLLADLDYQTSIQPNKDAFTDEILSETTESSIALKPGASIMLYRGNMQISLYGKIAITSDREKYSSDEAEVEASVTLTTFEFGGNVVLNNLKLGTHFKSGASEVIGLSYTEEGVDNTVKRQKSAYGGYGVFAQVQPAQKITLGAFVNVSIPESAEDLTSESPSIENLNEKNMTMLGVTAEANINPVVIQSTVSIMFQDDVSFTRITAYGGGSLGKADVGLLVDYSSISGEFKSEAIKGEVSSSIALFGLGFNLKT